MIATLTNDRSLDDPTTAQSRALSRLLETNADLDPSSADDQREIIQRYTLNTFFFAMNGDRWNVNDGWTTDSEVCTWVGITCDADKKVIGVELGENTMLGSVPSEIRGLSALTTFDVHSNFVVGSIPVTIGQLTILGKSMILWNLFASTLNFLML